MSDTPPPSYTKKPEETNSRKERSRSLSKQLSAISDRIRAMGQDTRHDYHNDPYSAGQSGERFLLMPRREKREMVVEEERVAGWEIREISKPNFPSRVTAFCSLPLILSLLSLSSLPLFASSKGYHSFYSDFPC
jgi:hypothetical protein